jgi:hypothetical protein
MLDGSRPTPRSHDPRIPQLSALCSPIGSALRFIFLPLFMTKGNRQNASDAEDGRSLLTMRFVTVYGSGSGSLFGARGREMLPGHRRRKMRRPPRALFCPFRATDIGGVVTQGGAALCAGLSCYGPFGALGRFNLLSCARRQAFE